MKVIITGINRSNDIKNHDRAELMNIYKFSNLSTLNRLAVKEKLIDECEDYWQEIYQKKDQDYQHKYQYYQLLPLFAHENILSHTTDSFDNTINKNGFAKGQLYTITAPSGKGKTSFCIMMTACLISGNNPYLKENKSFSNAKVLYITLEQSKEEIEKRFISTLSALNDLSGAISFGDLMNPSQFFNSKEYDLAVQLFLLYHDHLNIVSSEDLYNDLSIERIGEVISSKFNENNYDLVIIDQYDNIQGVDEFSSDIPIKIKQLALKLNVPIILQAQLNKASITNAQNAKGTIDSRKLTGNSLKGTSSLEHQSTSIFVITPSDEKQVIQGHEATKVIVSTPKSRYGISDNISLWHLGAFNIFLDECKAHKEDSRDTSKVVLLND